MRFGGRFLCITGMVMLASLGAVADEDAADWTAWLHYGRHMTLIDSHGHTLREVDLPLPEGNDVSDLHQEIGVSPDGRLAAYELSGWPDPQPTQLNIIDLTTNTGMANYSLEANVRSISPPSSQMFDKSGKTLALAHTATPSDFQLEVLNTKTAEVIYSVHVTTESLNLASDLTVMWVLVLRYAEGEVNFVLNLLDPDAGDPNLGSMERFINHFYVWNTVTGEVRHDVLFSNIETDTFPATGEIIAAVYNPLFPTDMFELGDPLENTLQVYDPTLNAVFPFYQADGVFPRGTYFGQNGARILTNLWDPERAGTGWYWALLERDGAVVDEWTLPENLQIGMVKNTPDGFLYTLQLKTGDYTWVDVPAVYEVDTRDNTLDVGRLVWQIPMKEFHSYFDSSQQAYFDIAWVHSDALVGPFKPWAQLAEPVYAPTFQPSGLTITPTPIPTPPPLFHVGQTVTVQTLDGEILNLRAEPTRASEILLYIEDDTRLELLEGPVSAEGFHWWRVRLPDGLEGWVVENDGDLQILVPD